MGCNAAARGQHSDGALQWRRATAGAGDSGKMRRRGAELAGDAGE